jgi:hypothetical protein
LSGQLFGGLSGGVAGGEVHRLRAGCGRRVGRGW